jgi:hypothetical protein
MLKEGQPAYTLYDKEPFLARTSRLSGGRDRDVYLSNPPVLALVCLPLAYMDVAVAREWWVWFSVLCFGLAIALIVEQLTGSLRLLPLTLLATLFTLFTPARDQFFHGQIYAFLLLLHVIGWRAYTRRRDALAGGALAFAMLLKISGWPIAWLMIARQRWRALGWLVAVVLAVAVASLPWLGLASWRTLLQVAVPEVMRWPAATLNVYQDTSGFWQHWLRYDAEFNPNPLIDAPRLAALLTLATTASACGLLWVRRRPDFISFSAAVALTELVSPAAEQYHYTLLLLPMSVLWYEAWTARSWPAMSAALIATILIGWPINLHAYHPAWALLLSYPRLIGGWILFGALLTRWRQHPASAVQGLFTNLWKLTESRSKSA